jgi:hypothetical protein
MKHIDNIDDIDRRILRALQADALLSHADLADRVGSSTASCWRRVRALEAAGILGPAVRLLDAAIYPPLLRYRLDLYEKIHRFYMSENLIEILLYANGFCIMGLNIYGVPDSMAQDPPLLDRSRRAPIDISTGRLWRSNYAPANEDHFLFASKNVGNDGQMGYFISSTGQVVGRGNGSPEVAEQTGPWANVTDWLASEIG